MASKTIARVKCDWAKIAQHVSLPQDATKLNKLKAAFDANAVKVSSLPETLPQIEWAHYKAHASDPKLVEEIQKMYNSIKIERPRAPTKRLEELNYHHKMDKKRFEKFATYVKSYIEAAEVVKSKYEKMIPVKDMTEEDFALTFPHWSCTLDAPPTIGFAWERTPGLSREEAAALAQPDPIPFATKKAWKDWDEKYKKWYE